MGTSNSFKISKTAVYICPFETNDVKMQAICSLKVIINIIFPLKKATISEWFWPELLSPPIWLPLSLSSPHMDLHPHIMKKTLSSNDLSFSKLKFPQSLRGEGTMQSLLPLTITTAQFHSSKPELLFCAGLNTACSVLEISNSEDLWQWSLTVNKAKCFSSVKHNTKTTNSSWILKP